MDLAKKIQELETLLHIISRSKVMWESTFDAFADPVLIINKSFDITRANLAFAKACHIDIREAIGKKCHQVFARCNKPCAKCPILNEPQTPTVSSSSQTPPRVELDMFPNGHEYQATAYCMPHVRGDNDETIVLHYREISDQKQLQHKLIHSEKMAAVGSLAGGVAHEINNPLGAILAFTQLIMRDLGETHKNYVDLKEIEDAVLRCKRIVGQLLEFSHQGATVAAQTLCLNDVITKSLPVIQMNAHQFQVQVAKNLETNLPAVVGNFGELQQVLLNLVQNALHAMQSQGGTLTLSTHTNPEHNKVFLKINDTGTGIPTEVLGRIFDPYFTTKKQGEGTGLGLSICYKIIQSHDGRIDVESQMGAGTTVVIQLPVR